MPYKFTAKELDEETGLYYYGARYLDPKYSMWISTDPALGDYIPKAPINEEAKKHNQNLPGMGGVFNHINGDLYAYAGNNPVRYIDPDGRDNEDDIIISDPEQIEKIIGNLGTNEKNFKLIPDIAKEYFTGVKKWNFVGEKPEKGNEDFSADTPEKEVKYYHNNPDFELVITEKTFTSFESNVGWNYGHDSRGYEFKFKIGDDYFVYYDINKDGWIDFTEEK